MSETKPVIEVKGEDIPREERPAQRRDLDSWGEPLNVALPPPIADIIRTVVQGGVSNKAIRDILKGFKQVQAQNRRVSKDCRREMARKRAEARKQRRQENKRQEEAEKEEAKEKEERVEDDTGDDSFADIPAFIQKRVEKAIENNEKIPDWVLNMLPKMQVPEEREAKKDEAFDDEEEEDADKQRRQRTQRLKRFQERQKAKASGRAEPVDPADFDNFGLPPAVPKENEKRKQGQKGPGCKKQQHQQQMRRSAGRRQGQRQSKQFKGKGKEVKNIQKHMKKNVGPYEFEIDLKLTEREFGNKKERPKNVEKKPKQQRKANPAKVVVQAKEAEPQKEDKKIEKEKEEEAPVDAAAAPPGIAAFLGGLGDDVLLQLLGAVQKELEKNQ